MKVIGEQAFANKKPKEQKVKKIIKKVQVLPLFAVQ
jgi:hypothetical protein